MDQKRSNILAWLFVLLYLSSLALPALIIDLSGYTQEEQVRHSPYVYGHDLLAFYSPRLITTSIYSAFTTGEYWVIPAGLAVAALSVIVGFLNVFLSIPTLAWLANPLAWLSFATIRTKTYKIALPAAIAAFFIGLLSFYLKTLQDGSDAGPSIVRELWVGFYVWELSFVVLLIYAISEYMRETSKVK